MADPFSITAGAFSVVSLSIQLLSGCIKGFVLLSTAHNLGKDASTIVCMLNLQEIQLTDWARRAGLLTGDGTLDRRLNAAAVEETLERIKDLLLNTEKLKSRYGLLLVPQKSSSHSTSKPKASHNSNQEAVFTGVSLETRREIFSKAQVVQETSIAKRLWWAAVDKDKIEKLVEDVHFFVRELWHLLTPLRDEDVADSMNSILANMVRMNSGFEQLMSINAAFSTLQRARTLVAGSEISGLAASAELKALQIVLDQNDRPASPEIMKRLPKRQEVLRKLERLSRPKLLSFSPMKKNDTMGMGTYDGERVFVEWKTFNPGLRGKLLPRVENLAALLNKPKDETFQSLVCKGLIEDGEKIGLVFRYPNLIPQAAKPRSLLDLFAKDGIEPPSLSDRIRLAVRVTQVVRNLHQTGWLHKDLRSENILFFQTTDLSTAMRATDFVLAGFNFARFGAPTEISEQPSAEPKHDIYRHPKAMGQPSESFNSLMDVYSLGTILLEIAEWRALRYLVDSVVDVGAECVQLDQLAEVQPFLLSSKGKGGTSKLRSKMGDIYASVCFMCLSGSSMRENEAESGHTSSQSSILDRAVRELKTCSI